MNHNFLKFLAISSLALGLIACGEDENKNNSSGDQNCTADVCKEDGTALLVCNKETGNMTETPCAYGCNLTTHVCNDAPSNGDDHGNKCTADVCKDENILFACNKNTGVVTETPCAAGCDMTANVCIELEKCTADVCKADGSSLIVCNKDSGLTTEKLCAYGCNSAENACYECTEDAHCGAGKICEGNKCGDVQCTADVCGEDKASVIPCVNGRIAETVACDGDTPKCGKGAAGNGADACVAEDWCSENADCTKEGKNYCNATAHVCTDQACSLKNCGEGSQCVLGVCVPDADFTAKRKAPCIKDNFVDHCRGNELWYCKYVDDDPVDVYEVDFIACNRGCFAYEDSSEVVSECAYSTTDYCDGAKSVSECEEYEDDWFTGAFLTTYTCTRSTNDEQITIKTEKSCGNYSSCNYTNDGCN